MKRPHRFIASALAFTTALSLGALGLTGPSASASGGGVATFAELAGAPPDYIFPFVNGAYGTDNNTTYLQPLMWLPLYWIGHPNSSAVTVDYALSLGNKP